jgi:hypothetical protein
MTTRSGSAIDGGENLARPPFMAMNRVNEPCYCARASPIALFDRLAAIDDGQLKSSRATRRAS